MSGYSPKAIAYPESSGFLVSGATPENSGDINLFDFFDRLFLFKRKFSTEKISALSLY